MLELLREKLKASGTSAADLRQAFKYVDEKKEGKVGLKGLFQALSLNPKLSKP
jgi:Ca2+-binding EF-hand superfamily protein